MDGHDRASGSGHRTPDDVGREQARDRRHGVGASDGPVGGQTQELGGPELRDRQAVAAHDDVAQVAADHLRGSRRRRRPASEAELARRAGDPHGVTRRLPRDPSRGGARGASGRHRPGGRINRRQHPAPAQRDVDAAGAVLREPARLVAGVEGHGELPRPRGRGRRRRSTSRSGSEAIALAPVTAHEERAPGDGRRRDEPHVTGVPKSGTGACEGIRRRRRGTRSPQRHHMEAKPMSLSGSPKAASGRSRPATGKSDDPFRLGPDGLMQPLAATSPPRTRRSTANRALPDAFVMTGRLPPSPDAEQALVVVVSFPCARPSPEPSRRPPP